MKSLELRPGEKVELKVYGDPRYGFTEPTVYHILTPDWGQDDGTNGNLFIECVAHPETGEPDSLVAASGDDAEHLDFGDPTVDPFIDGKVIRLAYQSF